MPKSAVSLAIPRDSLRKLPQGAAYHAKSGQASLTLRSGASGDIVAEASCDSLQRLVLWYEEEQNRVRSGKQEEKSTVRTPSERRANPVRTIIPAFLAGLAAGIVTTLLTKKKYGSK